MNKQMRPYLISILILSVLLCSMIPIRAQDASPVYAYLTMTDSSHATLKFISPGNFTDSIKSIVLMLPSGYTYSDILQTRPSPDGRKMMLFYSNSTIGDAVQIVDLATKQASVIAQLTHQDNLPLEQLVPVWSSNSQFLAFNGSLASNNTPQPLGWSVPNDAAMAKFQMPVGGTYIYSMKSKSLDLLRPETNEIMPYDLAWSPVADQLIVASRNCHNGVCRALVEAWAIDKNVAQSAIQIDAGDTVCNLALSPTGDIVSFSLPCFSLPDSNYFHEIFTWDIGQPTPVVLTHFTNPLPLPSSDQLKTYNAVYDSIWYDDKTLLVGITVNQIAFGAGVVPTSLVVNVQSYHYDNKTTRTLLTGKTVQGWSLSPTSKEVAFREETATPQSDNNITTLLVKGTFVDIGRLKGDDLEIVSQTPSGCNLAWSSDENWLAYITYNPDPPTCDALSLSTATSILFVGGKSDHQTKRYAVNGADWIPVGWLSIGADG